MPLFDPSKLADSAGDELSVAGYRNQTRRWDPLSDDGARRSGGRFNPPHSFPVIYLCTTRPCVVAELTRQARGQNLDVEDLLPRELWCLTVELTKVLDLTNGGTLRALDLDPTTSFGKTCSAPVRSERPPTGTVSRRFERPRQLASMT